jgi:type I site-specific restriction endonuclease
VIIYAVENHPSFGPRAIARLAAAQAVGDTFMLSDLVRMECLVKPFRTGDLVVEAAFQAFFARPDVRVVPVTLSADQIRFIDQIIDHLTQNGMMDPHALFEPPFTDLSDQGVMGVLPDQADKIVQVIQRINANVLVA